MPNKKPAARPQRKKTSPRSRKPRQPKEEKTSTISLSATPPSVPTPGPPPVLSGKNGVAEGAGFGIRLGARLVDTIYGSILSFFVGFFFGIVMVVLQRTGNIGPGWLEKLHKLNVSSLLLSVVGFVLYHGVMEGLYGASVGKLLCGLRVVTVDGLPCGLKSAFQRSLAYIWDSFFFGLVGYNSMQKSRLNQRYGDHWAGTVVVKEVQVPQGSRQPVWRLMVALAVGSGFWGMLILMGLLLKSIG